MKKKNENKGFTLVELIVVLVILAILAAILVPALLGYIDRARSQQTVLNAKSCLTAAQAELSSIYGKNSDQMTQADKTRIQTTADVPVYNLTIYVGKSSTNKHAAYTVYRVEYKQDANADPIYFDGEAWVESKATDFTTKKASENVDSFTEVAIWENGAVKSGAVDLKGTTTP